MFLLAAIALAVTSPVPQRLGLALNVPQGGGADSYVAAMRQQVRLGLDGAAISLKWDEFETQNGKPLDDGVGAARFMGQKALLTIATIDTVRRRLPADVANSNWDDPTLQSRFDKFLEKIAPKVKGDVQWISLGNEVNIYFGAHAQEESAYERFLAHARDSVHRLLPGVPVGVTIGYSDGVKTPALVKGLETGMDIAVFTYYPLDGMKVTPPTTVPEDFQKMKEAAGDRQLLLQEIGCPASPANGSSEELQSQFVTAVFKQLDAEGEQVPLACFFMQADFGTPQLDLFKGYYGIDDPTFRAFLGSLGLQDATGKPRKAWEVFAHECQRLKPILGLNAG